MWLTKNLRVSFRVCHENFQQAPPTTFILGEPPVNNLIPKFLLNFPSVLLFTRSYDNPESKRRFRIGSTLVSHA